MTKYLKSIKLDYVGIAAFLLFCITMKTFRGESTVNSQLSFADLFLSLLNSNSILSFPLSYVAILFPLIIAGGIFLSMRIKTKKE